MKQFLILCSVGIALWSTGLYAQDSIFDEGAEDEIKAEEISDDLKLWAENTALKLKEVLEDIKKLNYLQKREVLLQTIRESVKEAQGKRELLLMRFMLNRALKLEELFLGQDDALAVNYVLLPGVKHAIFLYENSDLPFLEANKDKPEGDIEPPPYAVFAKSSVGYLLTASNLNKSLRGQFEIVKLSVVWLAKDLLRSTTTRRNPVNARIILKLQKLYEALSQSQSPDHALANHARTVILEVKADIEDEKGVSEKREKAERERRKRAEKERRERAEIERRERAERERRERAERELAALREKGFVLIPAGSFFMGSPESEADRCRNVGESQHEVSLSRDFEIMTTEVTQEMWFDVMGENPSYFKTGSYCPKTYEERKNENGAIVLLCPDHPVEQVSWNDVQLFMDRINRLFDDSYTYRLPTEAEWEYVARAGTTTPFYFGETISTNQANYDGTDRYNTGLREKYDGIYREKTIPVGSLGYANAWRLLDMHGNVYEWTLDPYSHDYSKALSQEDANAGAFGGTGSVRVFRGGSWSSPPQYLRSASRNFHSPDDHGRHLGFRVLRTKK